MSRKALDLHRTSTNFLRLVIVMIGLFFAGLCLVVLPLGIASDNTGYYKFILAGLYIPAIPLFVTFGQTLKLLSLIDKNQAFSTQSVEVLRKIKYCAILISGLFSAGMPYIFYAADKDDAPGVVLFALIIIAISFIIGVFAAVLQKLFENAVAIKQENDLTV